MFCYLISNFTNKAYTLTALYNIPCIANVVTTQLIIYHFCFTICIRLFCICSPFIHLLQQLACICYNIYHCNMCIIYIATYNGLYTSFLSYYIPMLSQLYSYIASYVVNWLFKFTYCSYSQLLTLFICTYTLAYWSQFTVYNFVYLIITFQKVTNFTIFVHGQLCIQFDHGGQLVIPNKSWLDPRCNQLFCSYVHEQIVSQSAMCEQAQAYYASIISSIIGC